MAVSNESCEPNALVLAPGVVVPRSAVTFTASRSSGPGGQNVNKVNTRVTMVVAMADLSDHLPAWALRRLADLAGHRFVTDRVVITSGDSRSQLTNKRACLAKLRVLLVEAMQRPKVRRPTRPSAGAKRRRIEAKKRRGAIKRGRSSADADD